MKNKEQILIKYKELHLRYAPENFEEMKTIKDKRDLRWEDLIFMAVMNL